jgi:hypothetical protein
MYEHPEASWKLSANSSEFSGSFHEMIVSAGKQNELTSATDSEKWEV